MKQRLIGAAVLVALAVIFLPMLIGGPGDERANSQVSLDIPDRDTAGFERRELDLPTIPPQPKPDDALVVDDPNHVATVDMTAEAPRIDALSGEAVGGVASTPASAPAPAAPAPTPPAPAPVAPTPAPAPTPVATAPAAPAPAATAGRWAVNLGSYANTGNATALVSQLRQRGLAVYSETVSVDGKSAQRVRLGPYAQRSEAESARLSLRQIRTDLPAQVVSLEGESAPAAAKPAIAEGFAVQVGALSKQADAEALRERIRKAGFPAYVERVQTGSGTLWRVRVGPELQRANAEKVKIRLKTELDIDGNIVPHP